MIGILFRRAGSRRYHPGPMDVVSTSPLRVASLIWQPRAGSYSLTVLCKATFVLTPGEAQLAPEQDPLTRADEPWGAIPPGACAPRATSRPSSPAPTWSSWGARSRRAPSRRARSSFEWSRARSTNRWRFGARATAGWMGAPPAVRAFDVERRSLAHERVKGLKARRAGTCPAHGRIVPCGNVGK